MSEKNKSQTQIPNQKESPIQSIFSEIDMSKLLKELNIYVQDLIDLLPRKFPDNVVVIVGCYQDAPYEASIHNAELDADKYIEIVNDIEDIYCRDSKPYEDIERTVEYLERAFNKKVKKVVTIYDGYDALDIYIL